MRLFRLLVLIPIAVCAVFAAGKNRVLLVTDAEGVAGICRQEQTDPANAEMRALLTGEVNAAVRGFFAGGADEVLVWDAHDGSRSLSVLTIDPRAKLIRGNVGPTGLLDRGFVALAFIGQHARANRKAAVMAHSYSSLGIQTIRMNGKEVGEIETRAALAGWYGVPVVLLTGDRAAAEDLKAIVPGAETAVVKEGLGYYACISLSAKAARDLIEQKAASAFARRAEIPPYKIAGPVTIEIEYTTRHTPSPTAVRPPGVTLIAPRTIRYQGDDFMAAWSRWQSR